MQIRSAGVRLARAFILVAAAAGFMIQAGACAAQGKSRAICYTAYDDDFFYLAAVVSKPNLAGKETAPFKNPLVDDAVAIFLQSGDGGDRRTAKSVEMAVSAAGGAQMYRGAGAAPLTGFGDFLSDPTGTRVPFKFRVTRSGRLNEPGTDPDTGYTAEMAIPWLELGGPPKVGQRMRFNVVSYSAAGGSSPIVSLSSLVKSAGDVQNPSLWAEIVFVDSPVKTFESAPQARVCARVFANKPLIDGVVAQGEWNGVTAFGFSEGASGSVAYAPTAAMARIRPSVTLRKAPPPVLVASTPAAHLPPRSPQAVPKLVLALYRYDVQADPRKAAPEIPVRKADGSTLLATHPMSGEGPWMTYDSVDWHRGQLEALTRDGIHVILPVFRPGNGYAIRGLMTLAAALKAASQTDRDYPLVALCLDLSSVGLSSPSAKPRLYGAIEEFYLQIPREFRLSIPLTAANGGGSACVVVLSSSAGLADIDQSYVDYCRQRFAARFGSDLIILGASELKQRIKLDGYADDTRGASFGLDESGWIKIASLGAGCDDLRKNPSGQTPKPRADGRTYREAWKQALARRPDWVMIDGWNDFADGVEIAPTLEYGVQYEDLTRVYSHAFADSPGLRAGLVSHTIPSTLRAGATYSATIRLRNVGMIPWLPETQTIVYRWQKGNAGGGTWQTARVPAEVLSGQQLTLAVPLAAPASAGDYTLSLDIGTTRGKVGVASTAGMPLDIRIHVAAPGESSMPAYAARLIRSDLPGTLESGGTYQATVTLRNDGAETWKKAGGARITARLLRSPSASEKPDPLPLADASAALANDVAPGQEVTVIVPITFSEPNGAPLPSWSQSDPWTYQIVWEVAAGSSGTEGALTEPESVALVDADVGPVFIQDLTPYQLPGERRVPVKIGVRNHGPQTWRKDVTRIGCHWYYMDGVEALWEDETTPIVQDMPPGAEAQDILVWVTAPPFDGPYWLVLDLKIGDTWVSTLPSVRSGETRTHPIEVVHGRLAFVDLEKSYNLDAISNDSDRSDGAFDGAGHSLPSEIVPPFSTGGAAPSTMWQAAIGTGLSSSRRIAFKWGPKGDKEKNLIQCLGQRVPLSANPSKSEVYKMVHLLAAATRPDVIGAFKLEYVDGTQQLISFPVSRWDGPPTRGEQIGFTARRTHTRSGESDKAANLFHYAFKIVDPKKVAAILLPNAPDINIAAITLEK